MAFVSSQKRRVRKMLPAPHIPPAVLSDALSSHLLDITPWTRRIDDADIEHLADAVTTASATAGLVVERMLLANTEHTGMHSLAALCMAVGSSLREINLRGCVGVTDILIQHLGTACPSLRIVHLDRCSELTLTGFRVLFGRTKELDQLSVVGCRGVNDVVLQILAENCHHLRWLDVRGCDSVADIGCRALATGCPQLEYFNLSDGTRVTNKGIVDVARGCKGLRQLLVSSPGQFLRLGDDSLSLVGTFSTSLTELQLSGWQQLTDVGVRWISAGCTNLTRLGLAHCRYLTDKSMLAVSAGNVDLEWLDISHCKLISDVGLRHLSHGCLKLKYLNATGVYLLSDGRLQPVQVSRRLMERPNNAAFKGLTAARKAEAVEMLTASAEVGLPAFAQSCTQVETLILGACLHVGSACLRRAGQYLRLREFSLTDNETCKADGIQALLENGGHHLVSLDLSGTLSVSEDCQRAMGTRCGNLQKLSLNRCPSLTDDGFRYIIVGCRTLDTLLISDNPQLSDITCYHLSVSAGSKAAHVWDDEMERVLSSRKGGPSRCSLQTLHICNTRLVSDTGINWVLEQHPTLTEINIAGTTVTKGPLLLALNAFRPFCEIVHRDDFVGISLIRRACDHIREAEYENIWKQAAIIQLAWRRFQAKRTVRRARQAAMLSWVAVQLQAAARGKLCRKRIREEKARAEGQQRAWFVIQKAWIRFVIIRRRQRLRHIRSRLRVLHSLISLQRRWKLTLLIREEANATGALQATRLPKLRAATNIQRIWRGHKARQGLPQRRMEWAQWYTHRMRAARKIQLVLRGFVKTQVCRRAFLRLKRGVIIASRCWRRIIARRWRAAMLHSMSMGALGLQRLYRGWVGRNIAEAEKAVVLIRRQTRAVRAIWRAYKCAKLHRGLRASRQTRIRYRNAAVSIQSLIRGHAGRLRVAAIRAYEAQMHAYQLMLESWAALRIQCAWRRVIAVNIANKLRAERPHILLPGWQFPEYYNSHTVALPPKAQHDEWQVPRLSSPASPTRETLSPVNVSAAEAVNVSVWQLCSDDTTGHPYFYDAATGRSVWAATSDF